MSRFRKQLQLFDDHHAMLADEVRMEAYERAIRQVVRPGDRVVDLGAGLGILGFLALEAGAAHVVAIEKTDSIELARRIAEHNGFADRMTFLRASSKDVELEEPADVLLSETLGSFGVEENTLDFTKDARRLLKPDARMIPRALRLWLVPAEHPEPRLGFWRDVRGIDFSPALDEVVSRMSQVDLTIPSLMARPQVFQDVDLRAHDRVEVEDTLRFPVLRPGTIHGVGGWFQVSLCEGVTFSTGPEAPPTHWRQAFFPLREPVEVVPGDVFEATLWLGPSGPRSDDTVVRLRHRCTQVGDS